MGSRPALACCLLALDFQEMHLRVCPPGIDMRGRYYSTPLLVTIIRVRMAHMREQRLENMLDNRVEI